MVKKEDFKYHKIGREVAIYKMHGDKDSPDDVVLTKEDYQTMILIEAYLPVCYQSN